MAVHARLRDSRTVPRAHCFPWIEADDIQEQVYADHDNRYIGTPCNVWGIGALMYALVMADPYIPHELFLFHFCDGSGRPPMRTMGHPILDNQKCIYSRFFRQAVLTCLAFNPADRPRPREILAMCDEAYSALAVDPLGQTLPPAFYTADLHRRHVLQPPQNTPRATPPRYIGETYAAHGPEVDELGLGPGSSPASKRFQGPMWQPVPPSPQQQCDPGGRSPRTPPFVTASDPGGMQGLLHAGFDEPYVPARDQEGMRNRGIGDDDASMDMNVSSSRSVEVRVHGV